MLIFALFSIALSVFLLEFGDANRPVKTGADRSRILDPMARRLHRAGDFLIAEHGMDAARRLLAFGDRVDHLASAVGAIAARKDFWDIGPASRRIAHDHPAFVQFKAGKKLFENR